VNFKTDDISVQREILWLLISEWNDPVALCPININISDVFVTVTWLSCVCLSIAVQVIV